MNGDRDSGHPGLVPLCSLELCEVCSVVMKEAEVIVMKMLCSSGVLVK